METFLNDLRFSIICMDKLELKEIVLDQNLRLNEEEIVEREVLSKLVELTKNPFVIILSGIRRCGKSTLLNQLKKDNAGYYLNFDDDRLVNFHLNDFQKLYELFSELYGEKSIFYFDEIQNIKGWELFVRRLRDENKKVFITGSNASMLSKELGTHLTGRYVQLTLYPFSFREFLLLEKFDFLEKDLFTAKGKGRIKKLFNDYLVKGGIPEYLKTGSKEYLKTLYENILYKDVLVRYKLTNEKSLKELVYFISSNISKEISFNSLKNILGLGSSTTVKEYFDYLENSFLVFLVPKYSNSVKKQIYANKKVYLIDNGIALNTGYRLSKDSGRILENLVFLELKRKGFEVYYYRDKNECDFIIKDKKFKAIQVCFDLNKENKKREFAGLIEAMKKLKLSNGIILTYDQEDNFKLEGKKISVIPVWKWLLK